MKVHRFGLLPPATGRDVVMAQIKLSHDYYVRLVRRDNIRRSYERELLRLYAPFDLAWDLAEAAAQAYHEQASECRLSRADSRTRLPCTESYKDAKSKLQSAVSQMRIEERVARRHLGWMLMRMSDTHKELKRLERARASDLGLYPGTYLMVEARVDAAVKTPMWDGVSPVDLRIEPFDGSGAIGVHLQATSKQKALEGGLEGISVVTLLSQRDSRIRIAEPQPICNASGKLRKVPEDACTLLFRAASDGRDPVWATFPMRMHGQIPDGSRIKDARVNFDMVANRERWTLDLIVDDAACVAPVRNVAGAVAVDLGWRQFPGSLRACRWRGDPPFCSEPDLSGELRIAPIVLGGLIQAEHLRSLRDRLFDEAIAFVVQHLRALGDVPGWVRRMTTRSGGDTTPQLALAYMSGWKSCGRLRALIDAWREHEDFPPPDQALAWAKTDWHLWKWEAEQRERSLLRRREIYRCFARSLADRYQWLILENFDLRPLARRPEIDAESDAHAPRRNRQLTAPSELRSVLINAFGPDRVRLYPSEWTTQQDPTTGDIDRFDASSELDHVYSPSGDRWDQDDAASATLLRYWRERPGDSQTLEDARKARNPNKINAKGKSRFDRARSRKALSQRQSGVARELFDKAAE